jgi:1-acylglycerone phosphate reductase
MEQTKALYDTNVFGLIRTAKAVVPRMAEQVSKAKSNSNTKNTSHKPVFVVICSIRSEMSTPWSGMYSSSKAAVRTYTETLQMECRPLGVEVMLINPGAITSNIVKVRSVLLRNTIGPIFSTESRFPSCQLYSS